MAAWLAGNSVKPSQRPGGPRPPRGRGRRRCSRGRDSPPCSRLSRPTSTIITATTAFVRLSDRRGFLPRSCAPPGRLCRTVNGTRRRLRPTADDSTGENFQAERELRNKISLCDARRLRENSVTMNPSKALGAALLKFRYIVFYADNR